MMALKKNKKVNMSLLCLLGAIVFTLFSTSITAFAGPSKQQLELAHEIIAREDRVVEFKTIKELAKSLNIPAVYLFGGTAAAYGHYVHWDLQRERGELNLQRERFDYDYTSIFRSNQDIDIVIDGTPEQAKALEGALAQQFPFFQGQKSVWEVRLLRNDIGDKESLLDNPSFSHQNSDSNSTGLINLVGESEANAIRDLKDWDNSSSNYFLNDLVTDQLHYYYNPELHAGTNRAIQGKNPPILSAIRYLTKAFQYQLKISDEDKQHLKQVIDAFDTSPSGKDLKDHYVQGWMEKNGIKLIQNAIDMEYATKLSDELGLRKKLREASLNLNPYASSTVGTLYWWMSKEPLKKISDIGEEIPCPPESKGRAKDLVPGGIVAHETNSFDAYESITKAHTGEPNVFISREGNFPGEQADYGDGFYTLIGKAGARGTGMTIRFSINPFACEGRDFLLLGLDPNYGITALIFRNKAALSVIPESVQLSPVEYFNKLANGLTFDFNDSAVAERLKRKIINRLASISPQEIDEIHRLVDGSFKSLAQGKSKAEPALTVWLGSKYAKEMSSHELDLLMSAINSNTISSDFGVFLAKKFFLQKNAENLPYSDAHITALVNKGGIASFIALSILCSPQFENHPKAKEWMGKLIGNGEMDKLIAEYVISTINWEERPQAAKFLEKLVQHGNADETIADHLLSTPYWTQNPKSAVWLEKLFEHGKVDWQTLESIADRALSKVHPNKAELIEKFIESGNFGRLMVIKYILSKPNWKDHPKATAWVEKLINLHTPPKKVGWLATLMSREGITIDIDGAIAMHILSKPYWKEHPKAVEWSEMLLERGASEVAHDIVSCVFPTSQWQEYPKAAECLEKLIARGESRLSRRIAERVLSTPHWKEHPKAPELLKMLIQQGYADKSITYFTLKDKFWMNYFQTLLQMDRTPTLDEIKNFYKLTDDSSTGKCSPFNFFDIWTLPIIF
ncbi:MAG: hypothetical protein HQK52_15670 [Oligoflexia bacterium]|nr:hypothetical protein [Oligoflexia bacterium]